MSARPATPAPSTPSPARPRLPAPRSASTSPSASASPSASTAAVAAAPVAALRAAASSRAAERVHRAGAALSVWYLRAVAVLNLLGGVSAPFREQVRHHNSGDYYTPYLFTAGFASAVFTMFMAVMMRRRKRAAWIANTVLVVLFLLGVCVAMAADPDVRRHLFNWVSAVLTAGLLVALLLGRTEFRGRGDRSNPLLALGALIGGGALAMTLGTLLVSATNRLAGSGVLDRAHYVLLRGITLGMSSASIQDVAVPRWADVALNVLGVGVLLLVGYALFRAPRGREYQGRTDEDRLRGLLSRHGHEDSLGYFALRRDKAVVFSPTGKAAVVYRAVGGVCLASGDPLGDREAWPGAITEWLELCRRYAWIPAVLSASEEAGKVYARHGLDALEMGDEAVVDVPSFTLSGRAMRCVRQAHARVARAGYSIRVRRHGDLGSAEMSEVVRCSERWRIGRNERGFSTALGRLGDPADESCVLVECLDASGRRRALLSFVPWGAHDLSLDLMRRDPEAENGVFEFMVIELIRAAGELGVRRLSLNFAMFRAVFERGARLGAGPFLRAWRSVLLLASRWWQIESLYRANAKYRPEWVPRYVLFEHSRDLHRVALAALRAEGFLGEAAR